ncbi:MAG: hypothetical protein FWF98_03985 [Dehalococcoidia bacterium]|nr:hypothetical protein [Dehalococcoidia bacterium]
MTTADNEEIFENVWQDALANIENITSDDDDQRFLRALAMGGSVAAETLVTASPAIKQLWGDGNQQTAARLSLLFSLIMLSQLYIVAKQNPPQNFVAMLPKEVTATRIFHVFNGNPEESIQDFLHFDEQFSYDLEKHKHLTHTSCMMLARCSEICGHPCIDWKKVKWPVVELTHLTKGTITDSSPLRSKADIDAMLGSIDAGAQAMMSYYSGG